MTSETPLTAALAYIRRGWGVLPCHSTGGDGRCTCGHAGCTSPAKHPRTRQGLRDASTSPETVRSWWERWPGANIGVRTGAASGVVVLDIDPAHGGLHSLGQLRQLHGHMPGTLVARTGGGYHYWFAHPRGSVPNSASRIGPGLDIRGDGGYVIVPPSRHLVGTRYAWENATPLAPLPEWLENLCLPPVLRSTGTAVEVRGPGDSTTRWARAALHGEVENVRGASEGTRNATLNRAAFALGQLVGAGHLSETTVHDALVSAAQETGLGARESRATVASGLGAGTRSPRSPGFHRAVGDEPGPGLAAT